MHVFRYTISQVASEPAVVPGTVHMVLDKALTLRDRNRATDIAGDFKTVVKRGEREKAAFRRIPFEFSPTKPAPPLRPYQKSLSAAPSTL